MYQKLLTVFLSLYIVSLATSISGMEIFSGLLLVTLLIGEKRLSIKTVPFIKPISVFVCTILIGTLFCDAPGELKLYYASRMRFFLVYLILYWSLEALGIGFNWKKPLYFILAIITVYGIVQHFYPLDLVRPEGKKIYLYAMQNEKIGPLVLGTFNHHLTFANVFLFYACLVFTFGLSVFPKKIWMTLWGGILFLLVIWTHSRAAWLAVPLCIMIPAFKLGKKKAGVVFLLLCLLLGGIYFSSPSLRERFQRTFEMDQGLSYTPRFRLWRAQFEMFKDHPLFGIGWNNNERHAKEYIDRLYPEDISKNFYGHAHSEFLQILASSGFLGLIGYLWIWASVFIRNYQLMKKDDAWLAVALFAAFIGFHVQGFTQWNFGDAEVVHNVMFFWAVLASQKI